MLNYLEKYNNLSAELRQKVSSNSVMEAIALLEKNYSVSLATVIMRVMVQDLSIADLPKFFVFENSMEASKANKLTQDLKDQVFYDVADYLNIENEKPEVEKNYSQEDESPKGLVETSNFFFSHEDEEEIAKLSKTIETYSEKQKERKKEIEKKIDEVLAIVKISFSSVDMFNRFKHLTETYLRNVRNRIDIQESMMKSVESGGLGVDEMVADKLLSVMEDVKQGKKEKKVNKQEDLVNKEQKANVQKNILKNDFRARDVEYDFSKLLNKKGKKEFVKVVSSEVEKEEELVSSDNSFKDQVFNQDAYNQELEKEEKYKSIFQKLKNLPRKNEQENKQETEEDSGSLVVKAIQTEEERKKQQEKKKEILSPNQNDFILNLQKDNENKNNILVKIENSPKPEIVKKENKIETKITKQVKKVEYEDNPKQKLRIADVEYKKVLVGPVDELAQLTLTEFRRLDKDSLKASYKVEEKFKFLEEDTYTKKLEGIKAWRRSPLNKMYLSVGQESMIQNKSISEIFKGKNTADFLTEKEFYVIMDLNNRIKF